MEKPLVSICCVAYNHKEYIKDALEGFLMQEADFPFEVLIHDDASSDGTADIIREYEQKYPDIIKPIYQTENQYSQGISPSKNNYIRVKGEFVAICEGDDCWTNKNKLQIQIDALREYESLDLCFHPCLIIDEDRTGCEELHPSHNYYDNNVFDIATIIRGGGGFMPTASLVFRSNLLPIIIDNLDLCTNGPEDYFLQIICSERGGALLINDVMSIYRKNSISSILKQINKSSDKLLKFYILEINMLIGLNDFFAKKYSKDFESMVNKRLMLLSKKRTITLENKLDTYKMFKNKINVFYRIYFLLNLFAKTNKIPN